jgi:transcription-repair coupling factor (superfamily II helicase)
MVAASLEELLGALGRGPVDAFGATPPFCAYAAARLAEAEAFARPLVVVVAGEAEARRIAGDLELFLPAPEAAGDPAAPPRALRVPCPDTSPYAEVSPDRMALMARLAALFRLRRGGELSSPAVVVSAGSLLRRVIPPAELEALTGRLTSGGEIDRDRTADFLVRAGYARVGVVEDPGSFAVRGGVIDVFPPLYGYPVRAELFGDQIESLRSFDPESQRTLRELAEVHLGPVRETVPTSGAAVRARVLEAADAASHPSTATRRVLEAIEEGSEFVGIETLTPAFHAEMVPLWSYLPAGDRALWLVVDPDAVLAAAADEIEGARLRYQERLDDHRIAFPPSAHYVEPDEIEAAWERAGRRLCARRVELHRADAGADAGAGAPPALRFQVDDNQMVRGALERARKQQADELLRPLVNAIERWRGDGWRIAITSESAARTERLVALLGEYGVPAAGRAIDPLRFEALEPGAPLAVVRGRLSAGFALPAERIVLLTDDDIFGERRRVSPRQQAAAKRARQALLGGTADFSQLAPGDYLVHQVHGVGLYQGLTRLPIGDTPLDFLHLEYRGGNLYLPIYRLGEVQRYVGAEGLAPRIDRLGGLSWDKQRRKVKREVRALAEELLQLYAQRAALPGHAFPPGDALFSEFEATFEFEETPDQQQAIDDVLADMGRPQPMDRLVCGDVGYGKTEVALRAILRAALGGKQAAMLAPTTVLVEQHYQTMARRFTGWPLTVARLSRFQSRTEQLATIRGLAEGKIDAVVGTHRLLSSDVRFSDLGLLVIDEEQRFGVTHKEKLKKIRTQVDVLTLTATPIPRTLHLAMAGLRDLSIIATPPADRRSVRTFVASAEDAVVREGIRRELGRGGQVFFVCPRIAERRHAHDRSLEEWAAYLRELVPEARIAIAHGQMPAEALERAMVEFVGGRVDVLVSTTIIESGLDIARANTMFVVRADRFGLAQLYQLRGRIGRSRERASCYLLVPPPAELTDDARRRLETLQRFTDLGSGFLIASHDLEIRGAGELLGARQSGAIAAVGFDTYTSMLEEAVAELRGEEIVSARDPELNVEVPGFIPDDYVPDTNQRLDLYKRLAGAANADEVQAILEELADRYGPVPGEALLLGELMVLKALARRLRAQSLELTRTHVTLALPEDTPLPPARVAELVGRQGSGYRLTPDMRLRKSFDAAEQRAPAEAARAALAELCAGLPVRAAAAGAGGTHRIPAP